MLSMLLVVLATTCYHYVCDCIVKNHGHYVRRHLASFIEI